jgi:hypothetical protein
MQEGEDGADSPGGQRGDQYSEDGLEEQARLAGLALEDLGLPTDNRAHVEQVLLRAFLEVNEPAQRIDETWDLPACKRF